MGIRCVCDLRVQEARPSEADEQKEVGRRQVLKSSDLESGPGWSVTLMETPDVQMLACTGHTAALDTKTAPFRKDVNTSTKRPVTPVLPNTTTLPLEQGYRTYKMQTPV